MAKSSTSFKPGNKCFNMERLKNCARPEYWTVERIQELIDSLNEWSQKDDSITMAGWRGYNSVPLQTVEYLKEKSAVFADSYETCRSIVSNRLAQRTGQGGVHSSVLNMLMPVYDKDVKNHQIDMIKAKSKADAESQALSLDQVAKAQADGKLKKRK